MNEGPPLVTHRLTVAPDLAHRRGGQAKEFLMLVGWNLDDCFLTSRFFVESMGFQLFWPLKERPQNFKRGDIIFGDGHRGYVQRVKTASSE